jgi:hypothetical protein
MASSVTGIAVLNRDSRAGGATEGSDAGADLEHLRHPLNHSDAKTTSRYNRNTLTKTREVARAAGRRAGERRSRRMKTLSFFSNVLGLLICVLVSVQSVIMVWKSDPTLAIMLTLICVIATLRVTMDVLSSLIAALDDISRR